MPYHHCYQRGHNITTCPKIAELNQQVERERMEQTFYVRHVAFGSWSEPPVTMPYLRCCIEIKSETHDGYCGDPGDITESIMHDTRYMVIPEELQHDEFYDGDKKMIRRPETASFFEVFEYYDCGACGCCTQYRVKEIYMHK